MKIVFLTDKKWKQNTGTYTIRIVNTYSKFSEMGFETSEMLLTWNLKEILQMDCIVIHRIRLSLKFMILRILAWHKNIPIIFEIDDLIFSSSYRIPRKSMGFYYYLSNRVILKLSDKIFCSTEQLRLMVLGISGVDKEKVFYCPSIIPSNLLKNLNRLEPNIDSMNEINPERFRVIFASGGFVNSKNIEYVVNGLIKILDNNPLCLITILGNINFNIESKYISFVRSMSYSDYLDNYRDYDLLVIPNNEEEIFDNMKSMIKYLEAICMSDKIIVLTTPTIEAKMIISDGYNGFLEPLESLAQRIVEVASMSLGDRLTINRAARNTIRNNVNLSRAEIFWQGALLK